jgi:excisionase family DNA binding protein
VDKLLTVEDVAELLGIPKATLYRWRYNGCGPPGLAIGRHVRYRPDDIEKWLAEVRAAEDRRRVL